MSEQSQTREFRSPEAVIDFFRSQVSRNGTPDLAGVEEEIIVVNTQGKPVSHTQFQNFLGDFIHALPDGKVISGTTVHGEVLPVLKGKFAYGDVQPETNTTLVELAHAPTEQAWGTHAQSRDFTAQLKKTAAAHDMLVIGGGVVPTLCWDDFKRDDVVIPNADFTYSWTHMTQGTRPEYCRTVFGTASVHHNMGFNDPELMARYITTSLRIQPTMIALLGNSPLWDSEPAQVDGETLLSYRSRVQIDYGKIFGKQDGVTYLYPDYLIDPKADFSSIIEGYLDTPLDRTLVGGKKISCNGLTMRAYLGGYEKDGRTYYPDEAALTMMIREPIVDVRPSFTGSAPRVEARAHDCVSQQVAVAIDAFYRGILANLDEAQNLMSGLSNEEVRNARHAVCATGLATAVVHEDSSVQTQQDLIRRLLSVSEVGLESRGFGEAALLSPLFVLAESGHNPAQRLLSVRDNEAKDTQGLLRALDYAQQGFADGTRYVWPQNAPRAARATNVRGMTCSR